MSTHILNSAGARPDVATSGTPSGGLWVQAVDGDAPWVGTAEIEVSLDGENWVTSAASPLAADEYKTIPELAMAVRLNVTAYTSGELVCTLLQRGAFVSRGAATPAPPETHVEFNLVESTPFPLDWWHLRRAHVGGRLSGAWISFTQDGTTYVVSGDHEGVRANPVDWESSLAGATHGFAELAPGVVSAEDVALAYALALEDLGVTGVNVVGSTITIADAHGPQIGSPWSMDTSLRGMWGRQRHDFGGGDVDSAGAMGATALQHHTSPGDGRIRAVYLHGGGTGDVRLAIGYGPAYTTDAGGGLVLTGIVEGLATRSSDGLYVLVLRDPLPIDAADNLWVAWRGPSSASATYRLHSADPVGRGDVPSGEQLVSSQAEDDPSVPIGDGDSEYVHGDPFPGSPFSIYSFSGYVYERPDGGGHYPGSGGGEFRVGDQFGANFSTGIAAPFPGDPAILSNITETFRHPVPLLLRAGVLNAYEVAYTANAVGEDTGFAIYDWTGTNSSELPTTDAPPLLVDFGRVNLPPSISNAYYRIDLDAPLSLEGIEILGFCANHSAVGGGNAGTLSTRYDRFDDSAGYLTGWIDDGRQHSDIWPTGGNGFGNNAQYVTLNNGDMPIGDCEATWPAAFDAAASDLLPRNKWRQRWYATVPGITGSES